MSAMAVAIEKLATAADEQVQLLRRQERRELDEQRRRRDEERAGRGYQSEPRQLTFLSISRAVPGLAAQFERHVPAEFWNLDRHAAIVACPCGQEPVAEVGVPETCDCGRAYLYTGESVRVAFSPAKELVAS